jgi:hypothetical protein
MKEVQCSAERTVASVVVSPYPVGTRIYKRFPSHGWFRGTVQAIETDEEQEHKQQGVYYYYDILYSDGDSETLDHMEMEPLVRYADASTSPNTTTETIISSTTSSKSKAMMTTTTTTSTTDTGDDCSHSSTMSNGQYDENDDDDDSDFVDGMDHRNATANKNRCIESSDDDSDSSSDKKKDSVVPARISSQKRRLLQKKSSRTKRYRRGVVDDDDDDDDAADDAERHIDAPQRQSVATTSSLSDTTTAATGPSLHDCEGSPRRSPMRKCKEPTLLPPPPTVVVAGNQKKGKISSYFQKVAAIPQQRSNGGAAAADDGGIDSNHQNDTSSRKRRPVADTVTAVSKATKTKVLSSKTKSKCPPPLVVKKQKPTKVIKNESGMSISGGYDKQPYSGGKDLEVISDIQHMFDDMIARNIVPSPDTPGRIPALISLLQKLHNRPLRVATMCSGTESPILALDMLQNAIRDAVRQHPSIIPIPWSSVESSSSSNTTDIPYEKLFQVEHVFSCEIEPYKQAYIERNFHPPLLFRDIRELGNVHAYTAYGAYVPVPNTPGCVDVLIAGTSCVDYSNLNNQKVRKKNTHTHTHTPMSITICIGSNFFCDI